MRKISPKSQALAATTVAAAVLAAGLAGCFGGSDGGEKPPAYKGKNVIYDMYLQQGQVWTLWTDKNDGEVRPVQVDAWMFSLDPEGPFTVPGPTLRAREGDTLTVFFYFSSGHMPHTIHWHGLHVPWDMDGVPYVSQLPLGSGAMVGGAPTSLDSPFEYTFKLTQSGTYFYHCHVDTAHHVDMGMYGALIVDPADPEQDPPYDREYTLQLDEWDSSHIHDSARRENFGSGSGDPHVIADNVQSQARDVYSNSGPANEAKDATGLKPNRDWYPAQFPAYFPHYDTFLINGKAFPDTEVMHIAQGETIRIRFINTGFQVHAMHLHGHHMLVTHKDGFLLSAPYYADTILIGPAERYDVYVTGDNPGPWMIHDHIALNEANDYVSPGGMMTMLCYEDGWEPLPNTNPCAHGESMQAGALLQLQTEALKKRIPGLHRA